MFSSSCQASGHHFCACGMDSKWWHIQLCHLVPDQWGGWLPGYDDGSHQLHGKVQLHSDRSHLWLRVQYHDNRSHRPSCDQHTPSLCGQRYVTLRAEEDSWGLGFRV